MDIGPFHVDPSEVRWSLMALLGCLGMLCFEALSYRHLHGKMVTAFSEPRVFLLTTRCCSPARHR